MRASPPESIVEAQKPGLEDEKKRNGTINEVWVISLCRNRTLTLSQRWHILPLVTTCETL